MRKNVSHTRKGTMCVCVGNLKKKERAKNASKWRLADENNSTALLVFVLAKHL
jgi:hypothetical protein